MQAEGLKILKKNEIKYLERFLEKNYGSEINLRKFLVFESGIDKKIWIASKTVSRIDFKNINVSLVGMYFGKIKRNDKIHLSIEGSQIVGKNATKNIIDVDVNDAEKFLSGESLEIDKIKNCDYDNFVILKSGNDILGSSLLTEKGIKNLIPKSRRYMRILH